MHWRMGNRVGILIRGMAVVALGALAAWGAGLFVTDAAAQGKPLRMCYTTWGQHGGETLPGKGFIPDLVTRVFKHAGYAPTVDILPWPRCINLAKKRRYDMAASGWRGRNFDPHFEYLDITLRNDISFIVRKGSPLTSGELGNFEGKTIAYVRDSGGMDAVRRNTAIQTREVGKMVTMIPILHRGRVDAVITDPESFFIAAAEMDPPLKDAFRVLQPPLVTNFNSPLVPKGHPDLARFRADFSKAFKELVNGGIYDTLIDIHGPQFIYQVPLHAR